MPTPFIMPKFDMDQESATIVEWLKQEGDMVRIDEPVLVVETDKVAIDVPSPANGKLVRVSVEPGDSVPVTDIIAYILAEGETTADLPAVEEETAEVQPSEVQPSEFQAISPEQAESRAEKTPANRSATPVAARMAQELGIDLSKVSAENDRITKSDIQRYLSQLDTDENRESPAPPTRVTVPATPAARRLALESNLDLSKVTGSGPRGRLQVADVEAAVAAIRQSAVMPVGSPAKSATNSEQLLGIRRTIAERMQMSFQTAPHIALSVEVDLSQLEQTRSRMNLLLNQSAEAEPPQKVTITALLVRIVAWSLCRHPYINSSLKDDDILLWDQINIGVATAVDSGLIVPVIHNADKLQVTEINRNLRELAKRARSGQLRLEDVQGGTFTISNLGMFGIHQFRAIINPPESAILAVGQAVRKPVVIDERDEVEVRPMLSLTLSADHRVVDGVVAARFLNDVVRAIRAPDLLLL